MCFTQNLARHVSAQVGVKMRKVFGQYAKTFRHKVLKKISRVQKKTLCVLPKTWLDMSRPRLG